MKCQGDEIRDRTILVTFEVNVSRQKTVSLENQVNSEETEACEWGQVGNCKGH